MNVVILPFAVGLTTPSSTRQIGTGPGPGVVPGVSVTFECSAKSVSPVNGLVD